MLDHKEWLRINDIILIINSTIDIKTMRKYFLDAVKLLIPSNKSMFYLLKEEMGIIRLFDSVFINCDQDFLSSYEATFKEAQYGRVAVHSRKSIAYRDTDLMIESVRTNTDVYKSFLLPNKIPFAGGIILAKNRQLMAEITFFKTHKQGDITDKELCILEILKAHLENRFILENQNAQSAEYEFRDKTSRLLDYNLTNREIEISKLISTGLDTKEISDQLCISTYTTKKHIQNIFSKLDINSRTQLINFISKI